MKEISILSSANVRDIRDKLARFVILDDLINSPKVESLTLPEKIRLIWAYAKALFKLPSQTVLAKLLYVSKVLDAVISELERKETDNS